MPKSRRARTAPRKPSDRGAMVELLNRELRIADIKDSSCNGLQVQGTRTVQRVACAVDACMEAYRMAAEADCQMLVVHHGIIWDGIRSVSGEAYRHIKFLLDNDLNLYAAHLPLDLHPTLGNNARLARIMGLRNVKPFGLYKGISIGFEGTLGRATSASELGDLLTRKLGGDCTVLPFGPNPIRTVAVVSGGAAGELGEAVEKGIDCYVTGEPAHANYHLALEAGINVLYCGHYFSEKPGVQALGELLETRFGVSSMFLDIPTIL